MSALMRVSVFAAAAIFTVGCSKGSEPSKGAEMSSPSPATAPTNSTGAIGESSKAAGEDPKAAITRLAYYALPG